MVATTVGHERDAHGRFLPGHGVKSPGRPTREHEQSLAAAFQKACTPGKLAAITRTLIELSLDGDVGAIRLLFSYAMGQPIQRVELQEVEEVRIAGRTPGQVLEDIFDTLRGDGKEQIDTQ